MPHLDEGMLHAFLDGELAGIDAESAEGQRSRIEQHLTDCSECRAALEDARNTKAAADKILAAAGPADVSMPSFAELQARARVGDSQGDERSNGEEKTQKRSLHQMRHLAWAATVVLAAAVGWYARSTVLTARQDATVSEAETSGSLALQIPRVDSTPAEEAGEAVARLRGTAARDSEPENIREGEPLEIGGVQPQTAQSEADPQFGQPPAEAEEPKGAREAFTAPTQPAVDEVRLSRADSPPGAPAPAALQERQDVQADIQARRAVPEPVAPAPMLAGVAGEGADVGIVWVTVNESTASDVLERPVPIIEGLPVREYATAAHGGQQAIRVTQVLASGDMIHLTITADDAAGGFAESQKGAGNSAVAVDADAPLTNILVVQRGDLSIILDAPLSTDSLRALGEKITS